MIHFSVIMPLYNKAPYVRKAVESVVGQTYRDWELVVVDDGSSDGSGEVVAGVADARIRIIRQENAGVGATRNRGVAESSAPYICFLDADDWWEPTFLEEMEGLITRYPDAGIYGTGYWIVKNGKKRVAPIGVSEDFIEGEINYCRVYAKTLCMPLTSITVAMPRTVFEENAGFRKDLTVGEDFDLWIRITRNHKTILLNRQLCNYNQDVDATWRGTHRGKHNPRDPEHHYLWHLPFDDNEYDQNYKILIDRLRTYTLLPYYVDSRLRPYAIKEIRKVEWKNVDTQYRKLYHYPVFVIKATMFIQKKLLAIKQYILKKI